MKAVLDIFSNWSGINITKDSLKSVEDATSEIVSKIDKMLPEEPQILPEVKYEDLISWFSNQPLHPDVKYGVIARRRFDQSNIAIIQVFLDGRNNVILKYENHQYGRKIIAKSLDDEIIEAFGKKNIILVH
jgi:hypothetical protein